MLKFSHLTILIIAFVALSHEATRNISAEQIKLTAILPKLQAIHEDAQTLLIKNSEMKAAILKGLQEQNEKRLKEVKEAKLSGTLTTPPVVSTPAPIVEAVKNQTEAVDYAELEEFNKWVDINLDYAVKNTRASIESFRDEAATSNGNVDYSEQAIKDGIEGVKYWQSAVIFQDKILKGEKMEDD